MKTLTNCLVLILKKMRYAGGVLVIVSHLSQAADATLILNADIPEPDPCAVSVDPAFLSADSWEIKSNDIPNGKDISPTQTLTVTFSKCGPGSAGKLPAIRLSSPDTEGNPPSPTGSGFILRNDASSTSTGYWFVLPTKENGTAFTTAGLYNLADISNSTIPVSAIRGLSGSGLSKEIYVAVSCATKTVGGVTAPCASTAGTLKATLNIEFVYK